MKQTTYFNEDDVYQTITSFVNTKDEITIQIESAYELTENVSLNYQDIKEFAQDLLLLANNLEKRLKKNE